MKVRKYMKQNVKQLKEIIKKDEVIINTMEQWIHILNQGCNIADILCDFGLMNIAIYGMGHMGKLLFEQLWDSKINVSYVIDQRKLIMNAPVPVYQNNDVLPAVEAIIVTAVFYYDDIKRHLEEKNDGIAIISLEDLLYWN